MKKFILLCLCMLMAVASYAQDVISFTSGESVKAKVEEITETQVKYRLFDNLEGPLYTKSLNDIFSITYSNGKFETYQTLKSLVVNEGPTYKVDDCLVTKSEYESKLRRLNVWSKICKIYGWTMIGCSAVFFISSASEEDSDDWFDDLYTIDYTLLGTVAAVEGCASLVVGYSLQAKRKRLLKQNDLVHTMPVIQKEFKVCNCTLAPSVNLMSYSNNPIEGIGAGLNITF